MPFMGGKAWNHHLGSEPQRCRDLMISSSITLSLVAAVKYQFRGPHSTPGHQSLNLNFLGKDWGKSSQIEGLEHSAEVILKDGFQYLHLFLDDTESTDIIKRHMYRKRQELTLSEVFTSNSNQGELKTGKISNFYLPNTLGG